MKTAIVIVTMMAGKLYFLFEALIVICLVKMLKGVMR